jgi:hypothetical protein
MAKISVQQNFVIVTSENLSAMTILYSLLSEEAGSASMDIRDVSQSESLSSGEREPQIFIESILDLQKVAPDPGSDAQRPGFSVLGDML